MSRLEEQLIEKLAEIEHNQWVEWSKDIASKEKLSTDRLARWKTFWIPYSQLSEKVKEQDRIWARKSLASLSDHAVFYQFSPRWCEEHDVWDCGVCFADQG